MTGLEEHARRAAADANESVTRLSVPGLGGGSAPAGSRLVLAGTVVVSLLVVGALLLRGDSTSTTQVVADVEPPAAQNSVDPAPTVDAPRYFRPPFDAEWRFLARDNTPGTADPAGRWTLFGAGDDDDPIADGFVVVSTIEQDRFASNDETPVEVRGVEGAVIEDSAPGVVAIEWQESPGVSIQVGSDVLGIGQLVAFAQNLDIVGIDIDVSTPPEGMALLVAGSSARTLLGNLAGWSFAAFPPDQGEFVSLTGVPGDAATLLAARIVFGPGEPVSLRGTTGYRVSGAFANIVVWQEAGMLLSLFTNPDDDDDVVALAERVEPITDEEWAALVAASADPADGSDDERIDPPAQSYPTLPPRSDYPRIEPRTPGAIVDADLGAAFVSLARTAEGFLCATLQYEGVEDVSSCSVYDVVWLEDPDGALVMIGLAPTCTAQVTVVGHDGTESTTRLLDGLQGEVVFVATVEGIPAAFTAVGESTAELSFAVAQWAWDRNEVCSPEF